MRATMTFLALMAAGAFATAGDTALTPEFLEGRWSTGGVSGCTSEHASFVVFHGNHTLEAGKGGTVSTVGFWDIDNDRVVLHMLVSPSPGREAHPFFQQKYYYQHMAPKVLAVRPDNIDYTHDVDVDTAAAKQQTVTRCPPPASDTQP